MDDTNQKLDKISINSAESKEKAEKKFSFEGNAIYGSKYDSSNLFAKDNTRSEKFSILKINIERATLKEASNFKEFMEKSISEDNRNLIIDLNSCEFIDSSFFGILVAGLKRIKAMGMKFLIVFDSSEKLPIFSATGLDKVFSVYRNLEDAINS